MGSLRNGVPLDIVEDLLDVSASIERCREFDSRTSSDDAWKASAEMFGGVSNSKDLLSFAIVNIALGAKDEARACVDHMRECLRKYFERL